MKNQNDMLKLRRFGGDILKSGGMKKEKRCIQHGHVSVYLHSITVALMCIKLARLLRLKVNTSSLVRGALLHDYFLYDWHIPHECREKHATRHAAYAKENAERDFGLNDIEKNMIEAHMFPLGTKFPKYRESLILCAADKLCAAKETAEGFASRFFGKKAKTVHKSKARRESLALHK